jgi:mono/diheme cytochrome c family protein
MILPLVTVFLMLGHLFLIQKHGITAPWSDVNSDPPRTIPFHPYQTAKDSAAMLLITGCVLLMAWLVPAPLGLPADPNDTTFVPRPDWYFLFLFQSLKYFRGAWEPVGTFFLPSLALLLALALPWIDRNPSRSPLRRPAAMICLAAAVGLWGWLTYSATQTRPHTAVWAPPQAMPRAQRIKRPSEAGGMYVLQQRCFECHSMTVFGTRLPLQTLLHETFPSGESWFVAHLSAHGRQAVLSGKEIQELMSVLALVAHGDPKPLYTIPAGVRFGAHKFYNSSCSFCHTVAGQGGKKSEVKAPDLTLRLLRPRDWHIRHIRDSRSVVPNSQMPPFLHYEQFEYEALADYILYLHVP